MSLLMSNEETMSTKAMASNKRLMSLDALRGFDMLFIMGFSLVIREFCALFPGGADCALAQTVKHSAWDGLTLFDTIFPLFLFIAGVSFPFSYAKQLASNMSRRNIYMKILRRAVILIFLGMVYNDFFKLDFENLRVCSVLGRIGIAWSLAALLFINFSTKTRIVISSVILVGYWLLICYVPAPDVVGALPLSKEGNLVGYVDRMITPGTLIYGTFDPEGLLSALPAVVTAMLGMFTGEFVRRNDITEQKKAGYMGLASIALLAVGLVWSLVFPVNKALWSSSFVLVVGSYSLAMFALFYYVIDVRGYQKWATPFVVIGLNSITIYMAQRIIPFKSISAFFLQGFADMLPQEWSALLMRIGYLAVSWLFLYFLYKKKVFLKI